MSVREAAITAIKSIGQSSLSNAEFTGGDFTPREKEKLQEMVKSMRDYWGKNENIHLD